MFIKRVILLYFCFLIAACSTNKDYIPDNFFGLSLTKKLTGERAQSFVNNLHFSEVTEFENEIGFYSGKPGNALIYLTFYPTEKQAEEHYVQMTKKISPENSVFIKPEYLTINEVDLYRCFGMGQSHFVFSKNNKLFWISVDSHFGRKFIEEYLKYID